MLPWIQVYSNLLHHPKTSRLADELKLTSAAVNQNVVAVGILVSIWTWAVQNAYDGDLSRCGVRAIADACAWKKKPQTLVDALVSVGWLDEDMKLHDWEEYAVLLMDAEDNKREKTKERVKRYRDKKCNADVTVTQALHTPKESVTCNADVTVTQALRNADVTHLPYHTIPYHNSSNQSSLLMTTSKKGEEDINRAGARARADVGVVVREEKLGRVVADYQNRILGTAAPSSVVEALRHYCDVMDEDVIKDAFDVSLVQGKREWSYIRGVLESRERGGIKDMAGVIRDRERHRQTRAESGRKARDYGVESTPRASAEQIDRLDRMLARMEDDTS